MEYRLQKKIPSSIMVVGCGGTGGFVAEGLCRLFIGKHTYIYLVDHDRVEPPNIGRQNFYPEDLDKFKAEVLARRLSRQFNREMDYITTPIELMGVEWRCDLTIGCVDNPEAREKLMYAGYNMGGRYSYSYHGDWYIDAGNDENTGQVLIGNSLLKEVRKPFQGNTCHRLPLPQIQQPALIAPAPKPTRDCAEEVSAGDQSPVINRMMADLVLTFVYKLMQGNLTWMGAYINLDTGVIATVPATPETVAVIVGKTPKQLIYKPRSNIPR